MTGKKALSTIDGIQDIMSKNALIANNIPQIDAQIDRVVTAFRQAVIFLASHEKQSRALAIVLADNAVEVSMIVVLRKNFLPFRREERRTSKIVTSNYWALYTRVHNIKDIKLKHADLCDQLHEMRNTLYHLGGPEDDGFEVARWIGIAYSYCRDILELGAGYDIRNRFDEGTLKRLEEAINIAYDWQPWELTEPWDGTILSQTELYVVLPFGGEAHVRFPCILCDKMVYFEFIDIACPCLGAESISESDVEDGDSAQCDCGTEYSISWSNGIGGLMFTLESLYEGKKQKATTRKLVKAIEVLILGCDEQTTE